MCKVSLRTKCTETDGTPKRRVERCEWWIKTYGDSAVAEQAEREAKRTKNRKAREAAALKHKRLEKELKKHELENEKSATKSIKHVRPVLPPGDSCVPDEFDKIFLHPLHEDAEMSESKVFYKRCDGSIRDEAGTLMPIGPVRNYEGKLVNKRSGSNDLGGAGGEGEGRAERRVGWGGRAARGGVGGSEAEAKRHHDNVRDMGAEMERLGNDMLELGMALHAREKRHAEGRAMEGSGRGRGRDGGREGPAGRGGGREGSAGRGTWC